MRVISGSRKGAKLITREDEAVRPTTDRVKESMFNLIMEYLPCENVLDLFAGSGALSIEALSRGAKKAVCVDADKVSMDIVKKNYEKLRLSDSADFLLCDAFAFLGKCTDEFDIIFLDPPYNKGFIAPVMESIKKQSLLSDNGIIVLESDSTDALSEFSGFLLLKQRKYGRTLVTVYKKEVDD